MDVLCEVDGCGRPVQDTATVCTSCSYILNDVLNEIIGTGSLPGLAADLNVTLSKQDRIGDRSPGGSVEPPLPYHVGASEAAWILQNTLAGWITLVAKGTGAPPPRPTIGAQARWLQSYVGWLCHHQDGPEAVVEIVRAAQAARRTIDRPPALWYAGPCGAAVEQATCTGELYAHAGALRVICRDCGSVYNLAARREWLLAQVEDQLMHSIALAALVRHLGVRVADSTIRGYAMKGRIVAHSRDTRNRPLYRIGDVLEIVIGPRSPIKVSTTC
jgi:hypothetical protein